MKLNSKEGTITRLKQSTQMQQKEKNKQKYGILPSVCVRVHFDVLDEFVENLMTSALKIFLQVFLQHTFALCLSVSRYIALNILLKMRTYDYEVSKSMKEEERTRERNSDSQIDDGWKAESSSHNQNNIAGTTAIHKLLNTQCDGMLLLHITGTRI